MTPEDDDELLGQCFVYDINCGFGPTGFLPAEEHKEMAVLLSQLDNQDPRMRCRPAAIQQPTAGRPHESHRALLPALPPYAFGRHEIARGANKALGMILGGGQGFPKMKEHGLAEQHMHQIISLARIEGDTQAKRLENALEIMRDLRRARPAPPPTTSTSPHPVAI